MAEETKQQVEGEAQTHVPQARPCPQDCRQCGTNQQIYCSTQMLFNMSRAQQEMSKRISMLELALDDIKEQLQPKKDEVQLSIPFAE